MDTDVDSDAGDKEPTVWLRRLTAVLGSSLLALVVAGCGGSAANNSQPGTLTYWASQESNSIQQDQQVLGPELAKFQQQTGIKVQLQVIDWNSLQNRILAAVSSGQGPDVVDIGNTWAASLQATGAFLPFDDKALQAVGGRSRFLPSSMAATGAPGQPPTSIPQYGLAYGLYYNKKAFADAGITQPPKTWAELLDDARKLTNPAQGKWGLGIEGGSYTENAHFAFQFDRQHGGEPFNGTTPNFDSPQMVAAVRQYVDLIPTDKVVNPSNVEYSEAPQLYTDFAAGKIAMFMSQSQASAGLRSEGVPYDAYGIEPEPVLSPLPPGGKPVNSHVGGVNLSIFDNTKNLDGAMKLVNFLTNPEEQAILNNAFGSLPVVPSVYSDPRFQNPNIQMFRSVLANTSEPLPQVPQEAQFESLVGTAIKQLLADAASGKPVDDNAIRAALSSADQQMKSGG